jgi:serine/threonine protein kinase
MNDRIPSSIDAPAANSPADSTEGRTLPASALETGVQVGDFRIERRLGAGGMGIVYQARQVSLNRPVALKVLGQALTRSADVSRFQREAQAAARLKHPGIAQVYFIGQDRHLCFLAMELIDGVSLRRVLDRLETTEISATSLDSVVQEDLAAEPEAKAVRFDSPTEEPGPHRGEKLRQAVDGQAADGHVADGRGEINPYLSPQARELRTSSAYLRRACEVVRDAALALAHAHEQGVVHRDIKPDNLLLDREGRVHLIDFGVARFFDDHAVTYTGQLIGTPLYMSPEQVTGRGAIDARSDIYSLGLVLCELLTLRPPIEATNRENLLRTIVTKPLPPVSWRNKAVPAELERIVHRATQKDPDQRYATAADFAADLERFLAGKPAIAPPYHFRLDEREIVAARPSQVVLAAFIFFVVSFFVFVAMGSLSLFFGIITLGLKGDQFVRLATIAIPVVVLVAGLTIGRGLLSGRSWARWLGVLTAAGLTLVTIGATVSGVAAMIAFSSIDREKFEQAMEESMSKSVKERAAHSPDSIPTDAELKTTARNFLYAGFAMYALPVSLGFVLSGTALWALLSRPTGRWFRFAREVRLEHRRLKELLAN